jgi:hypothetical protein
MQCNPEGLAFKRALKGNNLIGGFGMDIGGTLMWMLIIDRSASFYSATISAYKLFIYSYWISILSLSTGARKPPLTIDHSGVAAANRCT